MGWLKNKFLGWTIDVKKREIDDFISRLRAMDGSEIGFVVAMATHVRHELEAGSGWDLLDPITLNVLHPMASYEIAKFIQDLQKAGAQPVAAGAMVWLHTVRAAGELDMRQSGRDMWRQLERGFVHVNEAADGHFELIGALLKTSGANLFPNGLTPEPL